MNDPVLSVKILLLKCLTEKMEKLVLENEYKIAVPLFGAAFAAQKRHSNLVLI